ncbi:hypothetical protein CHS0354_000524 [Potamilus streckersoni]|uniref:4-hydroxy-2-oxoglutarate aldolase, mitochondrial n=1 Tax=Potamilus streckersoni TaxID=2493646 RepID=A0AAE0W911_9BIVA|nr:hypothetical protein CHS0354_000524 [Potamilus streckersoni]
MAKNITGSCVALVTPFNLDYSIDFSALKTLVAFQIKEGTDCIIPCGTTGESTSLTLDEHRQILEVVVETTAKKIKVFAGAGSNNTLHAVSLVKQAEKAGVDGILSVAPYYNKPTQEGYKRHFMEIAAATSLPIILYNVPGRTGGNVNVDTMLELCQSIPNIISIKEASGNIQQIMSLLKNAPETVSILSGDDPLTYPMMTLGAKGVVSIAANQIPKIVKLLISLCLEKKYEEAKKIHNRYLDFFILTFIESNPIPAKYVLWKMGMINEVYRLPLLPLSNSSKKIMNTELNRLNIC